MFRGVSAISLDSKGRMAIPTKYRERLKESDDGLLVVTVDLDRCLLVYPYAEWEVVQAKLQGLSSTQARSRRMKRLMIGYAEDCEMDGTGRILLPATLREYAGLEKKVRLVGQTNKFELWSDEAWIDLTNDRESDGKWSADTDSDALKDFTY